MQIVNIHEAKSQLSRLLEKVLAGEDVVIARAGTPIARLTPYRPSPRHVSPPGAMEGEGWIAEDFDEAMDDLFECLDGDRP